jgi:hypothetical protein
MNDKARGVGQPAPLLTYICHVTMHDLVDRPAMFTVTVSATSAYEAMKQTHRRVRVLSPGLIINRVEVKP